MIRIYCFARGQAFIAYSETNCYLSGQAMVFKWVLLFSHSRFDC